MLSRVADSLFWMSRYIERAENTARLIDVNLQYLLEQGDIDDAAEETHWQAILSSLGDLTLFTEAHEKADTRSVTEFLTVSRENPSSLISCVLSARENARMIRDQISTEMWEVINRLYLYLRSQDASRVLQTGPSTFFQEVKEMSHLFRGVTDATFPRRVGYEFIRAGCYLERADKTSRILDTKHFLPRPKEGGTEDAIQWVAILRGCAGLEAYRRIFVGDVVRHHVVSFLVQSREFPRSILFCMSQLQVSLHAISACPPTHYSNEPERLCGRLISDLVYTSTNEIVNGGLHTLLEHISDTAGEIAVSLAQHYMFFPIVDPATDDPTESEPVSPPPNQTQSQSQSQSQFQTQRQGS